MKSIHVVTMGLVLAAVLALMALVTWRNGMKWDSDFRHHCVSLKRIYDAANGSCLGEARGAATVQARSSKAPGERSWDDLAAACKRVDGWLNSSAGNDSPMCTIRTAGDYKDLTPP